MDENIDNIVDIEEELLEPPVPCELEMDFDNRINYLDYIKPQDIKLSKDMERLNKRITLK